MADASIQTATVETKPLALMAVRAFRLRPHGFRTYSQNTFRTDLMFDLGGDRTRHAEACRDPDGIASALGMLRAVEGAERDRQTSFRCLYIMNAVGSEFCKIGVSVDPVARLATVQTCNPYQIELYACLFSPTMKAGSLEQAILRRAADNGFAAQGEWIRATPENALWLALDVAWSECFPVCDGRTWFDDMRDRTLRAARKRKIIHGRA